MAGERHIEKAIDALHARVSTTMPANLRAIEAAQGLGDGVLVDPVAYLKDETPRDNVTPSVEIYDDGFDYVDQRNRVMDVRAVVVFKYSGGVNLSTNRVRVQQYVNGILACVESDPTLGGAVVGCVIQSGDNASRFDESETFIVYAIEMTITVHSLDLV